MGIFLKLFLHNYEEKILKKISPSLQQAPPPTRSLICRCRVGECLRQSLTIFKECFLKKLKKKIFLTRTGKIIFVSDRFVQMKKWKCFPAIFLQKKFLHC